MTTARMHAADIPAAELHRQAAHAAPGPGLAQVAAAVFVAIGWVAGAAVTSLIFAALAVRYGYRLGRGRDPLTGAVPGEPAQPAR